MGGTPSEAIVVTRRERERERGVLSLLAIEHGSDKWLNRIYGETPPLRLV